MLKKIKSGQIRVIAGRWRGRKINVPLLEGLRPTTDAIRETLFNWLAPVIEGARCLDLFAGSGALGFEALSRGAHCVTFVDTSSEVISHLHTTLQQLSTTAEILKVDATKPFTCKNKPFDIVFLDPPFHQNLLEPVCTWLLASDLLTPQALIYLETPRGNHSLELPLGWSIVREKYHGQVRYYLIQRGDHESK